MSSLSHDAQNLNWLVANFANRVPGIADAVAVSADGLLLAVSDGLPRDRADQLAAIASGLVSLTHGAALCFEGGSVSQTVAHTAHGAQAAGSGVRRPEVIAFGVTVLVATVVLWWRER